MDDAAASQQLIDESKRANPAYDDQKPSQLSAHDTPASALTRQQKRKRRNRRNRQKKRESKETNENQKTSPEEDDKTSKQDNVPESSPVRFAETQPEADKIVSPAGETSCMLPGLGDIQGGPSEVAEDVTPAPAKKRKIGTPKSAITVQDLMETDPFEDSNSPPAKKTKLKRVKKPQTPTTIFRDIYEIPEDETDTANGSGEAQLPPVNDAPVLSGEERGADLQKNSHCNKHSASKYKTVNNSKVYDWAAPVRKFGELPSDDEEIMRSPLSTNDEVSADALYKADRNEKKTPKKRGRPRKSEMSETEKSKKRRRSSTRDDEVEDGGLKQDHINGSSDPLPPKKKRGRPRKSEIDTADTKTPKQDHTNESSDILPPKKKRGRPRKSETNKMEAEEPQHDRVMDEPSDPLPPKRKRGRPRKSEISKMEDEEPKQDHVVDESNALLPPKKKRGRPRKSEVHNVDANASKQGHINGSSDLLPPKRKRGRPRKSEVMEAEKSEQNQGPKRQVVDEGLEARQDEAQKDEAQKDEFQQNEVEDGQEQDDEVVSNQSQNGTDNGAHADDSEAGQGSEQECAEAEDRGCVEVENGPSASSRSAPGVDEMLWGDKFDLIFKLQDRRDELEEDIDWEDVRAAQGYPWARETLESALHGLIQNLRDNGKEVDMDDFAGTVDDVMDFICAEHGTELEEHYKAL